MGWRRLLVVSVTAVGVLAASCAERTREAPVSPDASRTPCDAVNLLRQFEWERRVLYQQAWSRWASIAAESVRDLSLKRREVFDDLGESYARTADRLHALRFQLLMEYEPSPELEALAQFADLSAGLFEADAGYWAADRFLHVWPPLPDQDALIGFLPVGFFEIRDETDLELVRALFDRCRQG